MLNTPSGKPASLYISANFITDKGLNSEGLKITQFPQAMAGADFHTAIEKG